MINQLIKNQSKRRLIKNMIKMLFGLQRETWPHCSLYKVIGFTALVTACISGVSCDLILKPDNNWAFNGSTDIVVLRCLSTYGYRLIWLSKACWNSETLRIYNGYRLIKNATSYCSVDNGSPGKYDLNLTATTNAAQRYVCREPGTLMEASAELIIIQSDPECNATKDGELITLTCRIQFYGNWPPVMQWTMDNSSEVISGGVTEALDRDILTSRINVSANQSHSVLYTCTTAFKIEKKPSETTANNVPTYNYTWTYKTEPQKSEGGDDSTKEPDVSGHTEKNEEYDKPKAEVISIPVLVIIMLVLLGVVGTPIIIGLACCIFCRKKKGKNEGENAAEVESIHSLFPKDTA